MYHLHLSFPLLVVQNYAIHIYACSTSQLKIVLNTPKTLYLNQGPQKITCQIFLPQNKMGKNKTLRKYFNHSHQFNSGVPPSIIFKINK